MPQIINTNILAINAQRQLNRSQSSQATSIERLSSGLRINSAKDDAAGLAISTRFETQIRGLNQAIRNANDGISLAQTAEGSLQEMGNILQRMRELAVQSANDSNSDQDRLSIQAEVDQLYDELGRISETTEFNGVKLLDGTAGTRTFQIGANAGQSLDFSLDSVTTRDLNLNGFSALGELNGGRISSSLFTTTATTFFSDGQVTINGVGLDALAQTTGDTTALTMTEVENIINNKTGLTGVSATAYNVVTGGIGVSGVVGTSLEINGQNVTRSGSVGELVDNINRDVSGITAALGSSGELILSNDTGNAITVAAGSEDAAAAGLTVDDYYGYLGLESFTGEAIEIDVDTSVGDGIATAALPQLLGFNLSEGSDKLTGGSVSGTFVAASDGIQINGIDLGKIQNGTTTSVSAADIAIGVNAISDQTGVEATASTEVTYEITLTNLGEGTVTSFTINSIAIDTSSSTVTSMEDFVQMVNAAGVLGVVASVEEASGKLKLRSEVGLDIVVGQSAADVLFVGATATTITTTGTISLESENGQDVTIESTATLEADKDTALAKLGYIDQGGNTTAIGLGLSVTTVGNSEVAIDRIDDALDTVSSVRANLGAFQNRLGSTIANLENVSQNLSSANSRIRDADFAVETANLTKTQILQQAGIAMLSQANASQQNVLSLLG